jgi:hypothetical protein
LQIENRECVAAIINQQSKIGNLPTDSGGKYFGKGTASAVPPTLNKNNGL